MQSIIPFIFVDNASEAIKLYEKAFHARVYGMSYLHEYEDVEDKTLIAQSTLIIYGDHLFIGDAYEQPNPISERSTIVIQVPTVEDVNRSFNVLKEGGHVYYEPAKLPWSDLGYSLKDSFGVVWMIYVVEQQ